MKLACDMPGCEGWLKDPSLQEYMKLACDYPGCGGNGWLVDPETEKLSRKMMAKLDTGLKFMGASKGTATQEKKLTPQDVVKMLDRRIPVNKQDERGLTLLMWASGTGNVAMAEFLLERGAKPDLTDKKGGTALMYAAAKGSPEIVSLLLDAKADPKLKSAEGKTAKEYAEKKGHKEVSALLK
ncbi:ankyrin repeat domain-containing protein [Thermodesulfobacteriota bacterium]